MREGKGWKERFSGNTKCSCLHNGVCQFTRFSIVGFERREKNSMQRDEIIKESEEIDSLLFSSIHCKKSTQSNELQLTNNSFNRRDSS